MRLAFVLLTTALLNPGAGQLDQPTADIQIHRNMGKAYYERGEYEAAVRMLVRVLDLGGDSARDTFNAGIAMLQHGDEDGALGALTTAKRMAPDMIEVDFGLGVLYKRQLRYPPALEAFRRVTDRDAGDPCTWFNIGAVNHSMEKYEEAEKAFRHVLAMGFPAAQNFYVSSLFRLSTLMAIQGS